MEHSQPSSQINFNADGGLSQTASQVRAKPRDRLVVTQLVLENFKSYAGTQVIGPLHHFFSAIVGPNGSGKSNVIDAILFVFGRQARDLRLKKVSEFIHHSELHQDIQQASVSVHFQSVIINEDDPQANTPVPGTEFVLTRTAKKNNQSSYAINGKVCPREEVVAMLIEKGVDLDNSRFLILQGEVEQIALMKPKALTPHETGLLEYLEEIIGSNKYVKDIEEASTELEVINEEKSQKRQRLKVVERERENLEGAKSEAVEYLTRQKEVFNKRATHQQLVRHHYEKQFRDAAAKKAEAQKKFEDHQKKRAEYSKESEDIARNYKQEKKAFDELGATMEKAKSEHSDKERKEIKLRAELKRLEGQQEKLKKEISAATKSLSEVQSTLKTNKEDIAKGEAEFEKLSKSLAKEEATLEEIYTSNRDKTMPLQKKLEAKQTDLIPFKKQVDEAKAKLDLAQSEHQMLGERAAVAQEQLTKAKSDLEEMTASVAEKKSQITEAKTALQESKTALKEAKEKLATLTTEDLRLSELVIQYRGEIDEITVSMQQAKSGNRLQESLNKARDTKQLPGLHGRLGDLGAIDKKYDVAISTACSALENFVVDSTRTARECVEFLKKHNLGRATFIILDEMKSFTQKSTEQFKAPNNTSRLFDLVTPRDSAYRAAFYYALRDTLVAPNLDVASEVGYGEKKRVVTLNGELIDASGTMSGGGAQKASGGMKHQVDAKETQRQTKNAEALKEQLQQATADLHKTRKLFTETEQEVQRLTKETHKLEMELQKMELDVKGIAKQREELAKRLPDLEAAASIQDEEEQNMARLEKEIAKHEKSVAEATKQASKLEADVAAVQKEIDDVGGLELKLQKNKVESLHANIATVNKTVGKAKAQITGAEKSIKKLEDQKREGETKQQKVTEDQESTEEELTQLRQAVSEALSNFKHQEEAYTEKKDALAEIKEKYDTVKQKEAQLKSTGVDLEQKVSDLEKTADDYKQRIEGCSRKIVEYGNEKKQLQIDEEDTDIEIEILSEEDLDSNKHNQKELETEVHILVEQLNQSKPNMGAIKEYREKQKLYEAREAELNEVTQRCDEKKKFFEDLRQKRLREFMDGYSVISLKLREMYRIITAGGDAELELVDSFDPFAEGILFSVRPPGKAWKNIHNLSGGEKTLSSLALVFALHYYKPTPIYIMDEIDAALDFKNVSIVANYIKERTKDAQFIIVSLRNYMFELADRLVGIFKTDNCTKSVTIDPNAFVTAK